MIRVEEATPESFAEVLPLFEVFRNPAISAERWRQLFDYTWPCEDRRRGFILRDGARAVGFFGTILYERTIEGRVEKFANLTSWVTLPEYRNHSLRLFEAVVAIEDRTLICLTPIASMYPLYRRFGFQDLETKWIVLLPLPGYWNPLSWFRGRITTNAEVIATELRGEPREFFCHLRAAQCEQMLVRHGGRRCHIVYTRTKGLRFHFSRIHYISDHEVFHACLDHIRWRMALASGALLLAIGGRLLRGKIPPMSRHTDLVQVAVYRSKTLRPEQIDNLYTELVLLPL